MTDPSRTPRTDAIALQFKDRNTLRSDEGLAYRLLAQDLERELADSKSRESELEQHVLEADRRISEAQKRATWLEHHNKCFRESNDRLAASMDEWCEALGVESGLEVAMEILHLREVAAGWHDKATAASTYAERLQELLREAVANRFYDVTRSLAVSALLDRMADALAKNPNPSGHTATEPSARESGGNQLGLSTEDSGPVGLGPAMARVTAAIMDGMTSELPSEANAAADEIMFGKNDARTVDVPGEKT